MGEDSELHGITLCQQVFLAGGRPLNIQLDVHVGSYLSHALGLHHNGADLINQNSGARDAMPGLEVLQQVGWGLLQAANLQNMQILWPYE